MSTEPDQRRGRHVHLDAPPATELGSVALSPGRLAMRKAQDGMLFYPGEESPQDIQDRVSSILPMHLESAIPTILVSHEEVLGAIASKLKLTWTRPTYGEVWYLMPKITKHS